MAPLMDRTDDLLGELENLQRDLLGVEEEEGSNACLICGNHPFFIGHIEKSNPNRMLVYALCEECYEKPDSDGIVEKIICYYETTRIHNPNLLDHCGEC